MAVLAAIPSTSVALVVTRSATSGCSNGIAVAIGIVLGDLIFIMLAILGLSVVAESMANLFTVIRYLGAAYLFWLGFTLLTSKDNAAISLNKNQSKGKLVTSFLAGFILTMGDVKAIIFYISLFPAFVDLSSIQTTEILTIIVVTVVSVGGVKVLYALSATKIANLSRGFSPWIPVRKIAGGFMIGAGSYLIAKI